MENDQVPLPFHFFGHVWLEEPTRFLDEEEYEALQRYMPLIRTLESEWQRRMSSQALCFRPVANSLRSRATTSVGS